MNLWLPLALVASLLSGPTLSAHDPVAAPGQNKAVQAAKQDVKLAKQRLRRLLAHEQKSRQPKRITKTFLIDEQGRMTEIAQEEQPKRDCDDCNGCTPVPKKLRPQRRARDKDAKQTPALDREIESLLRRLEATAKTPTQPKPVVKKPASPPQSDDAKQKRIDELEKEVSDLRDMIESLMKELNK